MLRFGVQILLALTATFAVGSNVSLKAAVLPPCQAKTTLAALLVDPLEFSAWVLPIRSDDCCSIAITFADTEGSQRPSVPLHWSKQKAVLDFWKGGSASQSHSGASATHGSAGSAVPPSRSDPTGEEGRDFLPSEGRCATPVAALHGIFRPPRG